MIMKRTTRIKLSELNSNLICILCGGYFIDATTIIECLHSFCRACIIKYLESCKYCPICDVQVHKTKPLLNIRSDQTLQDIVYKLVPGLLNSEMKRRRQYYASHPEAVPSSREDGGAIITQHYLYSPEETVSLSLEYCTKKAERKAVPNGEKKGFNVLIPVEHDCIDESHHRRYLSCPAAVTVSHLKKLIRAKFCLSEEYHIDVMYSDEPIGDNYSLMDIAYVYLWQRSAPLRLYYYIYGNPRKKVKLEMPAKPATVVELDEKKTDEWKEVQLQISESGEMSVREMDIEVSEVISSGKAKEETKDVEMISVDVLGLAPSPSKAKEETLPEDTLQAEKKQEKEDTKKNSPPKRTSAVGYKTLKAPPKTWNPTVTRSGGTSNSSASTGKRFFKARNSPRFLGNPSAGIKPIFGPSDNDAIDTRLKTAINNKTDVNANTSKKATVTTGKKDNAIKLSSKLTKNEEDKTHRKIKCNDNAKKVCSDDNIKEERMGSSADKQDAQTVVTSDNGDIFEGAKEKSLNESHATALKKKSLDIVSPTAVASDDLKKPASIVKSEAEDSRLPKETAQTDQVVANKKENLLAAEDLKQKSKPSDKSVAAEKMEKCLSADIKIKGHTNVISEEGSSSSITCTKQSSSPVDISSVNTTAKDAHSSVNKKAITTEDSKTCISSATVQSVTPKTSVADLKAKDNEHLLPPPTKRVYSAPQVRLPPLFQPFPYKYTPSHFPFPPHCFSNYSSNRPPPMPLTPPPPYVPSLGYHSSLPPMISMNRPTASPPPTVQRMPGTVSSRTSPPPFFIMPKVPSKLAGDGKEPLTINGNEAK